MTDTRYVLFVGGPFHGRRLNVGLLDGHPLPRLVLPAPVTGPLDSDTVTDVRPAEYTREQVQMFGRQFYVYVHDLVNADRPVRDHMMAGLAYNEDMYADWQDAEKANP